MRRIGHSSTTRSRRGTPGCAVVAALIVTSTLAGSATRPNTADAALPSGLTDPVDITDAAAVETYHRTYYQNQTVPPPGWTGSAPGCDPGTLSADYLDAALQRAIYFRNLAGSTTNLSLSGSQNASAQAAALLMTANNDIDHEPTSTSHPDCWPNVGSAAADAADQSNLAWSFGLPMSLPHTIDRWIEDDGVPSAGHRRWILHPDRTSIGLGETQEGSTVTAAYHLDSVVLDSWSISGRPGGFLTWPACGTDAAPAYAPAETAYRLFSVDRFGADWSSATVSLTRNGASVPTTIASTGSPFTFELASLPRPASDGNPSTLDYDEYRYTISGIGGASGTPSSFTCVTRVMDVNQTPEPPTDTPRFNVPENSSAVRYVGSVRATDADGDVLSYRLGAGCPGGSADNAAFTVSHGVLYTNRSFDHEAGANRTVCIVATDHRDGGTIRYHASVSITDVNERPTGIALTSTAVDVATTRTVGTLSATDPEHQPVSFSASGGFRVSGNALIAPTGISPGSHQVTITATDASGRSARRVFTIQVTSSTPPTTPPTTPPQEPDDPTGPADLFRGHVPERLADTRASSGAFPRSRLRSGEVLRLVDAGPPGGAASLNITAVGPTANGYVTPYPCELGRPLASALNYQAETTVANLAIVPTDSNGDVCIFVFAGASGSVDLVVDRSGVYQPRSGLTTQRPNRLFDSREQRRPLRSGEVYRIAGQPADAAIVINLTTTEQSGFGYLTAWPCDRARPTASVANFRPGQTRANSTVVSTGTTGEVCVFVGGHAGQTTHLVIDKYGTFTEQAEPVQPLRLLDSRSAIGDQRGQRTHFQLDFPRADGRGVILNLTLTNVGQRGYATAYPCADGRPTASNLNAEAGPGATANHVVIEPDRDGNVCFYLLRPADLLVDLMGYVD